MAMKPFFRGFWDDPWEGMTQPSRIFDQYFGTVVPDDFFRPFSVMYPRGYGPPMQQAPVQPPQQTGVSEVVNTDQEFRVSMDVQHFKPDEINIKTRDNRLIISAHHEERPDEHGFISREFTRQYVLPKDVDPGAVTSSLSRDGRLTLKAPKMALEAPKERIIPITQETEEKEQ
ncbi:alpha-crystallin B chain-like [Babylonia areolata]|uniref:alpha-crystallin B chain-like n=1 Tax=Babylonia areolata TaxID=304850 RepID=UPI003FD55506